MPYNFGVDDAAAQRGRHWASTPAACATSTRPTSCVAQELIVDQLAKAMRQGPVRVPPRVPEGRPRRGPSSTRPPRSAAGAGRCRRAPRRASRSTPSTRASCAALVEIDCRPETVNRQIADGVTGPRVTKVVFAVDVGLPINPTRPGGADDGRRHGRHRAGADLEPASARTARCSKAAGTTTSTRGSGTCPPTSQVIVMPPTTGAARRRRRVRRRGVVRPRSRAPTPAPPARCRPTFPINHDGPLGFDAAAHRAADPAEPDRRPRPHLLRRSSVPTHTFIAQRRAGHGRRAPDDVRLLWVLRDLLGVTGPKYGCGLDVCKACTCHINGKAFNPCSVQVADIKPTDEITTIEGLPATVGRGPAPDAAGLARPRRRPVRLLPAGADHGRGREGPAGQRRGPRDHRRRPRRDPQHLPLRHVLPHPRGDQGRRRATCRSAAHRPSPLRSRPAE